MRQITKLLYAMLLLCVLFPFSTFSAGEVSFSSGSSNTTEGSKTVSIPVTRSDTGGSASVRYKVTRSQARNHGRCTPQDFALTQGTLSFASGESTKNIALEVKDDSLQEGDEQIIITLSDAQNATLGSQKTHTFTIIDNDRRRMVSVKDFGAAGNGSTDDRGAIQRAVDSLASQGGGVLLFPSGDYLISDPVELKGNITYVGYGATTRRLPNQGKWERTFADTNGDKNIVVQGFTMDGNSQRQGAYNDHELQQAHLLFANNGTGIMVEDVKFQNGTGDGVSIADSAVTAKLCHIEAQDVFRGGVVITSAADVYVFDLLTHGDRDATGVDIETEGGSGGNIVMERLRLLDGDFDINIIKSTNTKFTARDVESLKPNYDLKSNSSSEITITDAKLAVGNRYRIQNKLVDPGKRLTMDHVDFMVTKSDSDTPFRAMDINWSYQANGGQTVVINNSTFSIDERTVRPSDTVYVLQTMGGKSGDKVTINGGKVNAGFDAIISPECQGCSYNPNAGSGTPGKREVNWGEIVSWFGEGGGSGSPNDSQNTQNPPQNGSQQTCHLLTPGTTIPASFAAPWNILTNQMLISVACSGSSATITLGTGSNLEYIYNQGYEYNGSSWSPVTLNGARRESSWLVGNASATVQKSAAQLSQNNFIVGYICVWSGTAWRCGCRDTQCSTPMWQLQAYRR